MFRPTPKGLWEDPDTVKAFFRWLESELRSRASLSLNSLIF